MDCYRVRTGKPMPYRCRDCRKYFSLKTGTLMEDSKLPLRVWGWAIYLEMTNLKGVSSMKLHRDLGISQPAAWFLLHRIRGAFADMRVSFAGPVEVDESYFGGKRANMSNERRKALTGRGTVGKQAVVAAKDLEGDLRRMTNKLLKRVDLAMKMQADLTRRPRTSRQYSKARSASEAMHWTCPAFTDS